MLQIRTQYVVNSFVRAGSAVLTLIGHRPITRMTIHGGDHAKEVRILLSPLASVGGYEHYRRDSISIAPVDNRVIRVYRARG